MAYPAPPQHFNLTAQTRAKATALEEVKHQLASGPPSGVAVLNCRDRMLTLPELRAIQGQLAAAGLELQAVEASEPLTLVPAAALGLATNLQADAVTPTDDGTIAAMATPLSIHQGTLRAGDHLQVDGCLLVLGDVNPGARVSAAGDVRIWGRLRGVAHAGCRGDRTARIVAMQLRPVQLRIAEALARGPEDQPPAGFCEEAVLVDGQIAIRPAQPCWPQERRAGEGRAVSD
ncbi:MAG: hypothetical protein RLZZ611_2517 [Cyanobacteriota bacterium]|jgi:septum site-determining protein MinC